MFDFESICLIGGVFVISAGTLFIIDYLFKNKSYEEAVAEQRQQNSALYNSQRPKLKEKKQKKSSKKVKEKKSSKETDSFDESENQTSDAGEPNKHHHVEFTEVTVIEEVAKEACIVKKDDSPKESPKGKGKKQNIENEPPKQQKSEMQKNKKSSKSNEGKKTVDVVDKPIAAEPVVEAPVVVTGSSTVSANPSPPAPPKDKKKKKSEISTLQQLAGDKSQEVNISILMPLVRNAEMSRDEVQILIDMLLNKQQDAPVADEWSEGKADPVQKLKRQLAEKEKLVVELEESLTGSQSKLREIRAEFNAEKSLLQQNAREHLENFNKCNAERQAVENKSQTLNMQCKHYNEEQSKMMDQLANLQLQHQQLEVLLAQSQEAEINQMQLFEQKLKDSLAEKDHRIAELIHKNKELEKNLDVEVQNKDKSRQIADEAMSMKKQLEAIRQQKEDEIKSYQSDITHLQSEQVTLSEENTQLKNEIVNLETEKSQYVYRLGKIEKVNVSFMEEAAHWTAEKSMLEDKNSKLQEENLKIQEENSKMQEDYSKMQEEDSKMLDEFSKMREEYALLQEESAALSSETDALLEEKSADAEEKVKLAKETEEIKELKLKLETDISKLHAENKKLHEDIAVLIESKKALEAESIGSLETNETQITQLQAELTEANSNFQNMKEQLHKQLEEQRNKNNIMITNARAEEQQASREFLERLIPDLGVSSSDPHDEWERQVEKSIEFEVNKWKVTASKEKRHMLEIIKLMSKVGDYKKIVAETEGVLSKLHNHIEAEEIRWRKELKSKDEKIESLEAEALVNKSNNLSIQTDSELDVSLTKPPTEVKTVKTKQTLSTASSATSSITEESVKKNKKKKKKNHGK